MDKVDTRLKILRLIDGGVSRIDDIAKQLHISKQAIHRYIKELLEDGFILKHGSSPQTSYTCNPSHRYTRIQDDFLMLRENVLSSFSKKEVVLKRTSKKHNLDFMLTSGAVYSSNIEGVSIDVNSFLNSQSNLHPARQKEVAEVQDALNAYTFAKERTLNEKNLLQIHAILSKHLISPARQGSYRRESVGVFGQEGLVYLGTEPFLITGEMKILFEITPSLLKEEMKPYEVLFWASWLHLEIALIHPFLDGNGRMARLLEKWFLAQKLGDAMWYIQTEKYYFERRGSYYKNLAKGPNYWSIAIEQFKDHFAMLFDYFEKEQ